MFSLLQDIFLLQNYSVFLTVIQMYLWQNAKTNAEQLAFESQNTKDLNSEGCFLNVFT